MSDNNSVGPKGTYEIYRAEGELLTKQGEYRKAVESYTMALEMRPDDKNCLVSRSKCYLQMGNAKLALEDAEKALAEDKDFNRGIACKAEALYHLGNFELALVFYHRGHKLRPEQQEFRLGIQKSQEAIENSIGTPEAVKLKSDGDLSFFWEAQQEDKPAKKKAGAGRYRKPGHNAAAKQEKQRPKNHGNDKTIKQLLGQLYAHREFLEKLYNDEAERIENWSQCEKCFKRTVDCKCHKYHIGKDDSRKAVESYQVNFHSTRYRFRDPDVMNPENVVPQQPEKDKDSDEANKDKNKNPAKPEKKDNNNRTTKISSTIQKLALDGINYLDSRTEFWRQQKPMYSRKRDKEMRDRDARRGSGRGARGDAAKYVLKNLEEIDQAQTESRYDDALKQSKNVLKTVEKWSNDDVPNREEVIANLHSCMGNSFLEKGEFEKSVKHHKKDLELAEKHDLPDAKSRAMDNLGRVYARMGKFDEAIEIWNQKVPLSKSALETTWLYHEIGRCQLELGQHSKAKDFGERSLAAAQEAEDDIWQLNASVLIAQSEVKSGDYQSAVDSFERSLEMAKAQGDSEAERAIKKALEDVNEKIVKGLKGEGEEDGDKDDADGQETGDQDTETAVQDDDGYDQEDFEVKEGEPQEPRVTEQEVQEAEVSAQENDNIEKEETKDTNDIEVEKDDVDEEKGENNEVDEKLIDEEDSGSKEANSPSEEQPDGTDEGTLYTDRTEKTDQSEDGEKKDKNETDDDKKSVDDNANEKDTNENPEDEQKKEEEAVEDKKEEE